MTAAAPVTTPVREAPLPTGNIPTPKKGAADKHRLLALVPPEGIQRVEREQGDRVNTWPHLLIEEFVAMFILLAALAIFSTFINAPAARAGQRRTSRRTRRRRRGTSWACRSCCATSTR